MESEIARRFMDALCRIEQTGEVDELASLFDEGASLRRISQRREFRGRAGAREFFREYLHAFETIDTEFQHVASGPGLAVLEWRSRGRLKHGEPIDYEGVSIVESNGEGRVVSFRTYYDASALTGGRLGRPGLRSTVMPTRA